jgi:hypothetical protein
MALSRWRAGDPWTSARLNDLLYTPALAASEGDSCGLTLSVAENITVGSSFSSTPTVTWDAVAWDTALMTDLVTDARLVTITESGLYEATVFFRFDNTSVTTTWWGTSIKVARDGSTWTEMAVDRVYGASTLYRPAICTVQTGERLEAGALLGLTCCTPSTAGTPKVYQGMLTVHRIGEM